ncbi:hypothetical protein SAMN04487857_101505 [Pseudomonas sp. ok272]|uniref:hypothetical protein n=1 Tax=unclassified Pseudomonas TaxID=196821 RepID=UPI0008D472CD|nr:MULTISPECIES: hypothetical protein [unclassified Pseudomonas]SEM38824.1 hypothetical protein SAMN04487857_101505 [Pseudomonas sp. ok272]SFM39643.1 hypothetical protein SAMN04487858_102507 [Pseudomonas sp. ok602]
MSKKPVFKCLPVIIRDKTVSSHTTGSVTTSKQGNNVSVTNNIGTDVKLEVVLEFPDGDLLPTILINESLHAPVGQKILMAFKEGQPVAYQVTPVGAIYPLGYVTRKSTLSAQDVMFMAIPIGGTIAGVGMACTSDSYYEDGEMKPYNASRLTGGLGLAAISLGIYVTGSWVAYIVGTALSAIPNTISCVYSNMKENAGRKLMLGDIKTEFDKLKTEL